MSLRNALAPAIALILGLTGAILTLFAQTLSPPRDTCEDTYLQTTRQIDKDLNDQISDIMRNPYGGTPAAKQKVINDLRRAADQQKQAASEALRNCESQYQQQVREYQQAKFQQDQAIQQAKIDAIKKQGAERLAQIRAAQVTRNQQFKASMDKIVAQIAQSGGEPRQRLQAQQQQLQQQYDRESQQSQAEEQQLQQQSSDNQPTIDPQAQAIINDANDANHAVGQPLNGRPPSGSNTGLGDPGTDIATNSPAQTDSEDILAKAAAVEKAAAEAKARELNALLGDPTKSPSTFDIGKQLGQGGDSPSGLDLGQFDKELKDNKNDKPDLSYFDGLSQRANDNAANASHAANPKSDFDDFDRLMKQADQKIADGQAHLDTSAGAQVATASNATNAVTDRKAADDQVPWYQSASTGLKDGDSLGGFSPKGAEVSKAFADGIRFANGVNNTPLQAAEGAQAVSDRFGAPVVLHYWGASGNVLVDGARTAGALVSGSAGADNVNALGIYGDMKKTVESGHDFNIVAHSAGTVDTQNAVNRYVKEVNSDPSLTDVERHNQLQRIHIVAAGPAAPEGSWPVLDIGSVHQIYHEDDGIARTTGPGDFFNKTPGSITTDHSFEGMDLPRIDPSMFHRSGSTVIHRDGTAETTWAKW